MAGEWDVDVEAGVGEGGLEEGAGGADGFVELVADEFEEAGHDLAQRGVEGGQRVGDVGREFGALVGVVDHAQEGAVGVAAPGVPGGLVVGVHLALAVAVLGVGVDGLVEGGGLHRWMLLAQPSRTRD